MNLIAWEIVSNGKNILNFFSILSIKLFAASQILSSVMYVVIIKQTFYKLKNTNTKNTSSWANSSQKITLFLVWKPVKFPYEYRLDFDFFV